MIEVLAERAPVLLKALREADPDFALLDGTLAECDRVGDSRADYSHCEDGGRVGTRSAGPVPVRVVPATGSASTLTRTCTSPPPLTTLASC